MTDAFSLLNINRDVLKDFHLLANRVDNLQIERVINQNMRKLKSIEERLLVDEGIKVSKQSIDEILYKVVQASRKLDFNMENWTMRELRIVSYYMMKLQDDENAYEYALMILDIGWRNMFFNGLVFYLMNSWCLIKPELRKSTSRLVVKKLQQYQENNRRYLMLKNHANLFEEMGPQRLALLLASQNKDVREAPLVLGSKAVAFSQSYFSDVIVKYCDRKTIDLDTLEEIFEAHNVARTKKLVFAEMVKRAEAFLEEHGLNDTIQELCDSEEVQALAKEHYQDFVKKTEELFASVPESRKEATEHVKESFHGYTFEVFMNDFKANFEVNEYKALAPILIAFFSSSF